ncbi:MAG: hypothetical protein VB008_02645 [Candidatus Elulimicrobiales bacterium]|nr:hypothetical protein [Candidatus Elulimicrobiales bacterium]
MTYNFKYIILAEAKNKYKHLNLFIMFILKEETLMVWSSALYAPKKETSTDTFENKNQKQEVEFFPEWMPALAEPSLN